MTVGGDALNEATILAKHGKSVYLETVLGNDDVGKYLCSHYARHGIELSEAVVKASYMIGINVVLVQKNGERNFLTNRNGSLDADPIEQAAVGAKRAVEEVPENANVVVLRGPSGNYHAEKRREAWDTYFFKERPDVKLLYEDYANWNSDEALTLMENWVQSGTHIDAIISMNDNMAAGAIEAIRNDKDYVSNGKANFLAYGVDGTAQGCLLIKEGLLTCTALQSAADIAKLNMEYADKVLKGEMKVTEVNDYVEAPEINAENVEEYIQIYVENGEISEGGELAE